MFAQSLIAISIAASAGHPPVQNPFRTCDGVIVQSLIGQRADKAVIDKARRLSGATLVREIKAGQPVAMNYLSGRLNYETDRKGRIVRIFCA
jgi:hypothetical protein